MMQAFISYSHNDSSSLIILHKHLAQLQRENLISAWTDNEINAGNKLDSGISNALLNSKIFIALISPDYLASKYCYEKEFEKALKMEQENNLIIIPVIIEDCDWLNTPFAQFKARQKMEKLLARGKIKTRLFWM